MPIVAAIVVAAPLWLWGLDAAAQMLFPTAPLPADAGADVYFQRLGAHVRDDPATAMLGTEATERPGAKAEGTFRIAVVGESTAAGVPYGPGLSFGTLLVEGLAAARPGRPRERFHVAEAARSTSGMLAVLESVIAAEPDLVLLYVGQNEYVQRLTTRAPFGKRRAAPAKWVPSLAEFLEAVAEPPTPPPSPALADLPAPQLQALEVASRVRAFGDRETDPWVHFPVTERERELHRARFAANVRSLFSKLAAGKIPVIAVRPTSRLDCPPLASGRGFDGRAAEAYALAQRSQQDPAPKRRLLEQARDLDPAPVRMSADFALEFDRAAAQANVPVVDADLCVREAYGEEISGRGGFSDFMHPRERAHARFAAHAARRMAEAGLLEGGPWSDAEEQAFRAATEAYITKNAAAVEAGEVESAQRAAFMYLVYGNRSAAEATMLELPEERRDLRGLLALDLALRLRGASAEADGLLARAVKRQPQWQRAVDLWRRGFDGR